jgi:hypothetical protein
VQFSGRSVGQASLAALGAASGFPPTDDALPCAAD